MMSFSLSSFELKNKIAIVTGGCGNLGPYWTLALLEAGASVAIIDLPGTTLPKELTKIRNQKIKLYFSDITRTDNLKIIHEDIQKDFGLIDILVNNAGIDVPPSKVKIPPTTLSKMWDVNVSGLVNCIEEFVPDMLKKGGSVVNIGSLYMEKSPVKDCYKHLNFDKPWIYGATKAAVGQITRHYATRLALYNIRVNTLSPGGVLANQDSEFINKYSQKVPLGRMAYKESDLGGPLVFLASDASSYVTGINLQVNGGYTAW